MNSDALQTINWVISTFFIQGVLSAFLTIILWQFFLTYKNRFLRWWAGSWLAFSVYLMAAGTALFLTQSTPATSPVRLGLTFTSISAGFTQLTFLMIGSYSLLLRRPIPKKVVYISLSVIITLALVMTFLYWDEPGFSRGRVFVRVGFRQLLTGLIFTVCGVFVFVYSRRSLGVGVVTIAVAFFLYGLGQTAYATSNILFLAGSKYHYSEVFIFMGVVDFLLQAMIGFGMVIWLLEVEQKRLQKTNRELDRFVYSASHDLSAPLKSVLGITSLYKLEKDTSQKEALVNHIETSVKRLENTVRGILDYSRNSRVGLTSETILLKEFCGDIVDGLRYMKGAEQIKVIYPSENASLQTDPVRLKMVLNNLLSNAFKYHDLSKPDPYISISLSNDEKYFCITLEDNGSGIAEADQQKVFDMFYRASEHSEGSGLGLYIVKEIINFLRGEIKIESKFGEYTRFHLRLPRQLSTISQPEQF